MRGNAGLTNAWKVKPRGKRKESGKWKGGRKRRGETEVNRITILSFLLLGNMGLNEQNHWTICQNCYAWCSGI